MLTPESNWCAAQGSSKTSESLVNSLKSYVDLGLTLYVGSDSMLYNNHCTFSCIVAVHSNDMNIANYYYQKQKLKDSQYKHLEVKILKEVSLSLDVANFLKHKIPTANIEIHLDIGDKDRNATRYLVERTRGWVRGMGYDVKIKPDSWASSVADWHTK